MKIRATIAILAAMTFTPALRAQSTAAPTKVGVINIQAAIASTAEGKQAAAELQSQFAPRHGTPNMQKQIEDIGTDCRPARRL